MHYIQGTDPFQLTFPSLVDFVDKDNPVMIIDTFIDKLDLDLLGFVSKPLKPEDSKEQKVSNPLDGRHSFHPKILLKLYFYGYFNSLPNLSGASEAAEGSKGKEAVISRCDGF